jgi:hypothetical protein
MNTSLRFVVLALAASLSACNVSGTVGETSRCSDCGPKQFCDETQGRCVECLVNADCVTSAAEHTNCRDSSDCLNDEGRCVDGRCQCDTSDMRCAADAACTDTCGDDEEVGQHQD